MDKSGYFRFKGRVQGVSFTAGGLNDDRIAAWRRCSRYAERDKDLKRMG
jgi:hypothetical protein